MDAVTSSSSIGFWLKIAMRPKKLTGPPLRNASVLNFEDAAAASQSRLEISHRFAVGANKPSPCRVATMDRSGLLRA